MKKSCGEKTEKLNNKQREKILWISVILISVIIFFFWIYNFIASIGEKIIDTQEKKMPAQITDFKKQLEGIKSQFKEFNLKNATSGYTKIKNIQEEFNTTSTNINNFNIE